MHRLTLLGLLLVLILGAATQGCSLFRGTDEEQPPPDWQEAKAILQDARDIAEGFRPTAELRGREDELDRVIQHIETAEEVVQARIDGDTGDSAAVEAVRLALDVSGAVVAEWPNPEERAVLSAVHATTRVALRAAHRRIEARREAEAQDGDDG